MPEKDLTRSVRLAKLQNYLTIKTLSGGATVDEIAAECAVSVRQVFRDLETLESKLGVSLNRPARGLKQVGRYRLDSPLPLKIDPRGAAIIFLSVLKQKGSPLASGINEIKDYLIASLFKNRYGSSKEELEMLQKRVHVVEEQLLDGAKSGEITLQLLDAISSNRVVSIKYYTPSRGEWSRRDVEPYGLTSKHSNWYLVGYCRKSYEVRTFRVDLIERVFVLMETFKFPADFNLENYFGNSWGIFSGEESREITVKVNRILVPRFKRIAYHPSQRVVEELADGSIIVSYRAAGMTEFLGWLLQWGELIEILKPADLRRQMQEMLEKILAQYNK